MGRASEFLRQLGDQLPGLAVHFVTMPVTRGEDPFLPPLTKQAYRVIAQLNRVSPTYANDQREVNVRLLKRDSLDFARRHPPLSSIAWLDSAAVLWPTRSEDVRSVWLFHRWDNTLSRIITPVLMQSARERCLSRADLHRFARAAALAAGQPSVRVIRELHEQLAGTGDAVLGATLLVQGDTLLAFRAFHRAAVRPDFAAAVHAARLWAELATAQHDTTELLLATTTEFLLSGIDVARKTVLAAQLSSLYSAVVAAHGIPPDIAVPEGTALQPLHASLSSVEAYLDRQFAVLHERGFPVLRHIAVVRNGTLSGLRRRIVVEYETHQYCGGCWYGDRVVQSLSRRYRPDDVIILTHHYGLPVREDADSASPRWLQWYPNYWNVRSTVIPRSSLVTAAGDTLKYGPWVDGRPVDPSPHESRWPSQDMSKRMLLASAAIDQDLRQDPPVTLQVIALERHDSVQVQVWLDSVPVRRGHRLALRLVLVEDTVRLRGATARWLYVNVIRADAHAPVLPMGLPLVPSTRPIMVVHTFDVGGIAKRLAVTHDSIVAAVHAVTTDSTAEPLAHYVAGDPEGRDWRIDLARLSVVAFVQDLTTGEVLQGVRAKIEMR